MLRVCAKTAAAIDQELMGSGAFSIDQLMELAGQAVSHALYAAHPEAKKVLVLVGPGNNGGDGLVASRHLHLMGIEPRVFYPKPTKKDLYDRLVTQLENMDIKFVDPEANLETEIKNTDVVIDSLFGFSFKPPVRGIFEPVMELLSTTNKPVLSVDIPSGWDVDEGPKGSKFMPSTLVSLTCPKKCAEHFTGRHFIGGRFIDKKFAEKFGFDVPPYEGTSQVYEE